MAKQNASIVIPRYIPTPRDQERVTFLRNEGCCPSFKERLYVLEQKAFHKLGM